MYADDFLDNKLNERKQANAFRQLRLHNNQIDFCSNDYLGIVTNHLIPNAQLPAPTGSTGSRLLAGNYALIEETENLIASFHQSERALIFNAGYDANVGLLSSVPQRGDTVLYDYLAHASIRDGIRLSLAQSHHFLHNDLNDVEKKLQQAKGTVFVVTESVFSMDGDMGPLPDMVALCERYGAHLIVDEAHATGVIGSRGEGLVQHMGLQEKVFARVHTFGKACGCHGAVVLGSKKLSDYLINFARSFIYSTALPPHAVEVIQASYQLFPTMVAEREHLQQLIQQFQYSQLAFEKLPSDTPIQIVLVPGNDAVKSIAAKLQQNNLDVRPILYPTVPQGKERLRIVLHAFNSKAEVELLVNVLSK
jgi:8-amino-7-oxononanoate synthase